MTVLFNTQRDRGPRFPLPTRLLPAFSLPQGASVMQRSAATSESSSPMARSWASTGPSPPAPPLLLPRSTRRDGALGWLPNTTGRRCVSRRIRTPRPARSFSKTTRSGIRGRCQPNGWSTSLSGSRTSNCCQVGSYGCMVGARARAPSLVGKPEELPGSWSIRARSTPARAPYWRKLLLDYVSGFRFSYRRPLSAGSGSGYPTR